MSAFMNTTVNTFFSQKAISEVGVAKVSSLDTNLTGYPVSGLKGVPATYQPLNRYPGSLR